MKSLAMSIMCADTLFAAVDANRRVQRIAGGNETEVYCTDDGNYVIKVKSEGGGSVEAALAEAKVLRSAAQAFTDALGPEHTIPNYFFVARNNQGEAQPVVMQPYVRNAQSLYEVDYSTLTEEERRTLADQLRWLIRLSLTFYRRTGHMPDLYGRTSRSKAERKRLNAPHMFPCRLWSFLIKRNLLRSHNLLLSRAPERRLVLVDYDPIKKSQLYQLIYYTVRRLLFLRDLLLIKWMEHTGRVFRLRRLLRLD